MAKRKSHKRAKSVKPNGAPNTPPTAAAADSATRIYACFEWHSLSLGGRVKFKNGFFVTDDPEVQRIIENATGFGAQIQEVTEAAHRKMAITEDGKVYLSLRDPSLSIEHRLTFRDGIYSTQNEDLQRLVEQHPGFGTQIREITDAVMLWAKGEDQERAQAVA